MDHTFVSHIAATCEVGDTKKTFFKEDKLLNLTEVT